MRTFTLNDEMFAELKLLAEPLEDTSESLIARLIHDEVLRRGTSINGNGRVGSVMDNALQLNPDSHDSLAHTRVLAAMVDGHDLHRPKWNMIRDRLHVLGAKRFSSVDALRQASGANLRKAKYEEEGFKYLPEAGISIQGVDANLAWDHSLRLARSLGLPIRVLFEWREKEGAVHPGKRGVLEWKPKAPGVS